MGGRAGSGVGLTHRTQGFETGRVPIIMKPVLQQTSTPELCASDTFSTTVVEDATETLVFEDLEPSPVRYRQ